MSVSARRSGDTPRVLSGNLMDSIVVQPLYGTWSLRIYHSDVYEGGGDIWREYGKNIHEGATITVTNKMRAFLHANGIHLKKTTKTIKIPARPYLKFPKTYKPEGVKGRVFMKKLKKLMTIIGEEINRGDIVAKVTGKGAKIRGLRNI